MRTVMFVSVVVVLAAVAAQSADDPKVAGACMTCHKEKTPGLYNQWFESDHARHNVTCLSCHQAAKGEPDAYTHYGATVATLVTPKDCGQCHKKAAEEVGNSYHASAGQILDSKDAYLAHVAAGDPVAILGCESCHGARVEIDPSSPNRLARSSWPNSGIGRINPDGSLGSCNACHTRHGFSKAQARQPEACSKCHLGPDHPQKEVYEESKHGNTYFTNTDTMNLHSDSWVVGVDYSTAPTCASCHMSATRKQPITHDVGQRIAWTLRPPVSTHKDDWRNKRSNMREVCTACHTTTFTDGHFYQFDASVRLYNEKFAKPATDLINLVRERGLLDNPAAFANKIEWIYWEIWHHEGRRARHGAAMMGPDYTWWHGFYDIAQHFYFKLLPEARKLGDAEVDAFIDRLLDSDPMHRWVREQTDDLKRQIRSGEMQQIYSKFFSES
jgi:hypothetical protein